MRPVFSLLVLFLCLCVTSCGQKGPLYLPDDDDNQSQEQQKDNKNKKDQDQNQSTSN